MKRCLPRLLGYLGLPFVAAAWVLAIRLVWEQTALSWTRGPQMIGFSLVHSGLGGMLLLALYAGVIWAGAVLVAAAWARSFGGRLVVLSLLAYAVAWGLLALPYGFWQRLFIAKYSPQHAIEFLTYAAATGDLRTVKAFLNRGVDVNAQGQNGTALHGAAVAGELEVIEFLLEHGADVNATNPSGDSPLANAMEARQRPRETQALLMRHGAKVVRGSDAQRDRALEERFRKSMKEFDEGMSKEYEGRSKEYERRWKE